MARARSPRDYSNWQNKAILRAWNLQNQVRFCEKFPPRNPRDKTGDDRGETSGRAGRAAVQKLTANLGVRSGEETEDPLGRSNIPPASPSRKASASAVFTTSAYFAFMSQRLIAWLASERSKQPSSASAMR